MSSSKLILSLRVFLPSLSRMSWKDPRTRLQSSRSFERCGYIQPITRYNKLTYPQSRINTSMHLKFHDKSHKSDKQHQITPYIMFHVLSLLSDTDINGFISRQERAVCVSIRNMWVRKDYLEGRVETMDSLYCIFLILNYDMEAQQLPPQYLSPDQLSEAFVSSSGSIVTPLFETLNLKFSHKNVGNTLHISAAILHANFQQLELNPMLTEEFSSAIQLLTATKSQFWHGNYTDCIVLTTKVYKPTQDPFSNYQNIKNLIIDLNRILQPLRSILSLFNVTKCWSLKVSVETIKQQHRQKVKEILRSKGIESQQCEPVKAKCIPKAVKTIEWMQKVENSTKDSNSQSESLVFRSQNCSINKYKFQVKYAQESSWREKELAVKWKTPFKDDEKNEKVLKEQAIIARLTATDPQHFVQSYTSDHDNLKIYMDYIPDSLHSYTYDGNTHQMGTMIKLSTQLCQAVSVMHQSGIVHRDLKPSNILVTNCESDVLLKIIDFGQSADMTESFSPQGLYKLGCTLPYSPLECMGESPQGFNCVEIDYWSVGMILFEMMQQRTVVNYMQIFQADINEMWAKDISLCLKAKETPGALMFAVDIINLLTMLSLKYHPKQRLPLAKTHRVLQLTAQYYQQITATIANLCSHST